MTVTDEQLDLDLDLEDEEELSPAQQYCKDNEFSEDVTEAFVYMSEQRYPSLSLLRDAYDVWSSWGELDDSDFISAVEELTGQTAVMCEDCDQPTWQDESTPVENGYKTVCNEDCINDYPYCENCEEYVRGSTTTVEDQEFCDSCRANNASFCDECDAWYLDSNSEEHEHECECYAPHTSFTFPANGSGTVTNDERLTVTLPKGTIDEEGIKAITKLVKGHLGWPHHAEVEEAIEEVGPLWQAKRGNFTRRLGSALHSRGLKLGKDVVSEVGNTARRHSSDTAVWHIEFTRDLNQSAEYFYHDDSCWWTDHSESRCALKSWGGLAIRSFSDEDAPDWRPSGRAWIQPLDANLRPTHDAVNAHAYVVYNGYGDFEEYPHAARIVAHLTGRTYKKIDFRAYHQYVNGNSGYLVASEEVCSETSGINLSGGLHDRYDANDIRRAA